MIYLKKKSKIKKYKVCLEYHLGNCKGACEAKETEQIYLENISAIRDILKGNFKTLYRFSKVKCKI